MSTPRRRMSCPCCRKGEARAELRQGEERLTRDASPREKQATRQPPTDGRRETRSPIFSVRRIASASLFRIAASRSRENPEHFFFRKFETGDACGFGRFREIAPSFWQLAESQAEKKIFFWNLPSRDFDSPTSILSAMVFVLESRLALFPDAWKKHRRVFQCASPFSWKRSQNPN